MNRTDSIVSRIRPNRRAVVVSLLVITLGIDQIIAGGAGGAGGAEGAGRARAATGAPEPGKPASAKPAAAKPVPRMNAYFASDFTDTKYQQDAVNQVLKHWKLTAPLPAIGKKTVVISTIGRDGALLDTRFNLKSGSDAFDAAALAAVKGAAPFAPFAGSYPRPTVEVHWHFEIGK